MQIYIAASAQNEEVVTALALDLENDGHDVYLFCRDADEEHLRMLRAGEPEWWLNSHGAYQVSKASIAQAISADLVIYAGGRADTWAEVGAAAAAGVPVWGLMQALRPIPVGVHRHLVDTWCSTVEIIKRLRKATRLEARQQEAAHA